MPKPQSKTQESLSNVSVYTWGTNDQGKDGMGAFMDTMLKGGNVGHASIEVSFPADKTGRRLIENYCFKDNESLIPFEKVTIPVQVNTADENADPIIEYKEVYKVYFSGWPGDTVTVGEGEEAKEETELSLIQGVNLDQVNERDGVQFGSGGTQSPIEGLSFEQREYKGKAGTKLVTLGPQNIIHLRNIAKDSNELDYAKAYTESLMLEDLKNAADILQSKLYKNLNEADGTPLPTNSTAGRLLDKIIPDWRDNVKNPEQLSKSDQIKLLAEVRKLDEDIEVVLENKIQEVENKKQNVIHSHNETINNEAQRLKNDVAKANSSEEKNELLKNMKRDNPHVYYFYKLNELDEKKDCLKIIDQKYNPLDVSGSLKDLLFPEDGESRLGDWKSHFKDALKDNDTFKNVELDNLNRDNVNIYQLQEIAAVSKLLLKDMKAEKQQLMGELERNKELPPILSEKSIHYITLGKPPDHVVTLPIGAVEQASEANRPGMNVENMLARMKQIATEEKSFDLRLKNCSNLTTEILVAGADQKHQHMLGRKDWGGFNNPQQVLNNANAYQTCVVSNKGELTRRQRISRANPLKKIREAKGAALYGAADQQNTKPKRVALAAGGLALAAMTSPVSGGKKAKNAIKRCIQNHRDKKNVKAASIQYRQESLEKGGHEKATKVIRNSDPERAIKRYIKAVRENPEATPTFGTKTMFHVSRYLNNLDLSIEYNQKLSNAYQRASKKVAHRQSLKTADAKVGSMDNLREDLVQLNMTLALGEMNIDEQTKQLLDKHMIGWEDKVSDISKLSQAEAEALRSEVETKLGKLQSETAKIKEEQSKYQHPEQAEEPEQAQEQDIDSEEPQAETQKVKEEEPEKHAKAMPEDAPPVAAPKDDRQEKLQTLDTEIQALEKANGEFFPLSWKVPVNMIDDEAKALLDKYIENWKEVQEREPDRLEQLVNEKFQEIQDEMKAKKTERDELKREIQENPIIVEHKEEPEIPAEAMPEDAPPVAAPKDGKQEKLQTLDSDIQALEKANGEFFPLSWKVPVNMIDDEAKALLDKYIENWKEVQEREPDRLEQLVNEKFQEIQDEMKAKKTERDELKREIQENPIIVEHKEELDSPAAIDSEEIVELHEPLDLKIAREKEPEIPVDEIPEDAPPVAAPKDDRQEKLQSLDTEIQALEKANGEFSPLSWKVPVNMIDDEAKALLDKYIQNWKEVQEQEPDRLEQLVNEKFQEIQDEMKAKKTERDELKKQIQENPIKVELKDEKPPHESKENIIDGASAQSRKDTVLQALHEVIDIKEEHKNAPAQAAPESNKQNVLGLLEEVASSKAESSQADADEKRKMKPS